MKNAYKVLVQKLEGLRPCMRPRRMRVYPKVSRLESRMKSTITINMKGYGSKTH